MQLPVQASGRVTLGWNASVDPNVAGYIINYGVASRAYTNSVTVGNVTTASISNLVEGTTYFFAAKAYNSANAQSDFSNEASYSVPTSANQPPTLNAIGNLTVAEDVGPQTVNLSGIGSGATNESQTLTVIATSSNTGLVPNPTVTYTSPNSTGALTFAPVANANGTATIIVTVSDGQASNNVVTRTFTVTINPVNDVPTLGALSNLAINENAGVQTVNLSGITSGAANEVQSLTVTATSGNTSFIPNPTVSYTSPNSSGTLSFTPAPNTTGTATITVMVNDGGPNNNIVTRNFTVTVNGANDAPTLNPLGNLTLTEDDGAQTVNLSGITSGASGENQTLTVTATSSNTGLVPNPTVAYTSPNSAGTLTFTPVSDANGTATITVTVNDGAASNNIVTRSFTVTVNPVNDPPTLNAISNLTINEGAANQTVNFSGIGSGAVNENQTLTLTAVSSNPSLIPDPTVTYTSPNATGKIVFKPVAYGFGSATIIVAVNDGGPSNNVITRTFTVTVNPVNQAPAVGAINNLTINEGSGPQTVNLLGITSGMTNENDTLTVSAVSSNPGLIPNPTVNYTSPSTNGTLSFAPVVYMYGTATITVTVNDGGAANNTFTRSFTVTVKSVNQSPTLDPVSDLTIINGTRGPRTVTLTGITSGAPNENQNLTVTAASSNPGLVPNPTVSYASPNSTGTMTLTPATGVYGTARLTVTVTDGGASNNVVTRAFNVLVSPNNQAPTLDPISSLALTENAGVQTVALTGITAGGSNEFQTLSVTATSSDTDLIPNPTVSYTSPNTTGSLSFTPANNSFGGAVITVTVNDGEAANNTVSQSFWVGVDPAVAQLSIGSTVLQAGQSGSVPVNFSSSEGVTAMNVVLKVPANHLTNLTLQAFAPEVDPASVSLVPQAGATALLHLAARPGQSILGSKQIAQLAFTAISNQQSAFVPVNALPFSAVKADGTLLANRPAGSGRAVVVGKEALLEATRDANGNRGLILYAKPASTFAIEYTTSLSAPRTWTRLSPNLSLNTLATPVSLLNPVPSQVLYRAAQISAAP